MTVAHRRGARALALVAALLWATCSNAQAVDPTAAAPYGDAVADDHVYVHGLLDEFEGRFGSDPSAQLRWDGEAWLGTDTNLLWLKSEGFASAGQVSDGDQELLYARPISTYSNLQLGARYDLDSGAGRGWGALGVEGLAPYFFQYSATLYASDGGHFAAKVLVNYEELLTQRLILEPLAELNLYSRSDPERGVGSGLSDLDAGLRLRYEITRKFAPYLGVVYQRNEGPTANGESTGSTGRVQGWRFGLGVRAWF